MRKEIRFAGFGGQGILLSGIILGRAAALYENSYAFQTQSIGPEARGGISRAEVVISDNPKDYPKVRNLDVLVAMSQESLDTYTKDLSSGKILIYDPDMMNNHPNRDDIEIYPVPATKTAYNLGNKIVANVVMLGALVSITNVISKESLKNAVVDAVPSKFNELNLKALEKGFELGHNIKE
ncbi:MAG: 2-oxoglutarate ferredoxin oxidoreductase subunit gamma [Methanothermococcus sp.]|jgi:2-oxoglutarate ferredoxin oxidoreductase subunit gamma|uniref:Pyruvate/2-ketoisovalerate oxidoreductase gamma subunit n=1 Tax=Methanococcus maripaludis KA1 TaxID=637914 RepID=A0A2Z5PDI5_METMI|nr:MULTISPECIES: 2-oxoacid:acceptor oxidoreductase family protein [Methanococcaceae]MDK2790416.1 2-oxoglutarate ferredoxin oxidoreductase subunit gamma [Methanothermococcus sp.]MDK2987945.1 2-oxoglutarate ferredoxin oxidoreductase subunit gamma [Methanothermococcus sp.]BAP61219.1 pyruvate/2-ketoisovalerate oxidoreductase gamma subunit [Methanococcus maripaludis KA1]